MTTTLKRSVWLATLVACLLGGMVALDARSEQTPADNADRLRGTFLQLASGHGAWEREQWRQLVGYFRELGLQEVVVQWTLLDEVAFYDTQTFASAEVAPLRRPPLETILNLADDAGLRVRVGLAASASFWQQADEHPELFEVRLARLYLRSVAVAEELAPSVVQHPSFRGWYITEEIDDETWSEARRQDTLLEYLGTLSTRLKELTPTATVSVSGFSNAFLDPAAFGEFWGRVLDRAPIDTVLFQDGIGAGKLEPGEVPLYLEAIRGASAARSRDLQVVVEVFRQTDGPPINDEPFAAVPAGFDEILGQLRMAAEYAADGVIAFSVPEYMSPLGGDEAADRYEQYRRHIGR